MRNIHLSPSCFYFFIVVCSPRLEQLVLFCVCKIIIVARPSLVKFI